MTAGEGVRVLEGLVAFVTGGASGIGREIAGTLACAGATLVVADIDVDAAGEVASTIGAQSHGNCTGVYVDVTDPAGVRTAVDEAISKYGGVDILANSAGVMNPPSPFISSSVDSWRREVDVNLYGTMYCCHAVLPSMVDRGRGRIVNIASDAGRVGEPNVVVYSATKAAVIGFTKALAKEVGRFGIRVNCISPGITDTPMTASVGFTDEQLRRIERSYPLGRLGRAEDHARAALFLVSEAADWITGQTLSVSGGYTTL
jgi:NAD(P)-dependent dehydrogenase (short-subunit alcohol dehydrogenase family)